MEGNANPKSTSMKKYIKKNIAWLNGHWGSKTELKIPISERALNFGDGIFETILILNGTPILLEQHLQRWK